MARRFHRKDSLSALSEINVTPLIDLAFALLIIFMITAPLLEQSIALDLPKEATKAQNEPEQEVARTISIDTDGNYFWGSDAVSATELQGLLLSASQQTPEPVIHLRADGAVPYQQVVTVIDWIKQYPLTQLSLDTQAQ